MYKQLIFACICVPQVLLALPAARVQERVPCGGHRHAGLRGVRPAALPWKLSLRLPGYRHQGHCGVLRWAGHMGAPRCWTFFWITPQSDDSVVTVSWVKNKLVYQSQTVDSPQACRTAWQTPCESLLLNTGRCADTESPQLADCMLTLAGS